MAIGTAIGDAAPIEGVPGRGRLHHVKDFAS